MHTRTRILIVQATAALVAALLAGPTTTAQQPLGTLYAIQGGRIVTAAGAPIDSGTVLVRNGVIEAVGADVTSPPDALVIDAAGLTVYPGLIDMGNAAPIDTGEEPAPAGGRGAFGGGGGRGGGGGGQQFATLEDAERAKREAILRPHFMAAANLRTASDAQQALASAGVTTVLAVPSSGIFKGQSALVNVLVAADDPQISAIADYRKGLAVVKSPVASHIDMGGRGGGQGYPASLLGTIAFTRQEILNARWQRDAVAHYERTGRGQRPLVEPPLTALEPVLAGELRAAFDASLAREIDRALAVASEFGLDPILVGAAEADVRTDEIKAAGASVIFSLNLPGSGRGGTGGGGFGGRGGGGSPSLRQMLAEQDAPKIPAALAAAGIPFAFTSGGLSPADFVQSARRIVSDGGLPADQALRALTIDAAALAGAADRTGSIEPGKIANLVVTEGDLLTDGRVRHVFIDGQPVEITAAPAAPATGRGRGGGRR